MNSRRWIDFEFVEFIPDELADLTLYISVPYATAAHACPCGCGARIVTPLSPTDWELTFDGDAVSLYPSVGNWALPCQSHYWIRRNEIVWAPSWTAYEIEAGRNNDWRAKQRYYERELTSADRDHVPRRLGHTWFARMREWLSRR